MGTYVSSINVWKLLQTKHCVIVDVEDHALLVQASLYGLYLEFMLNILMPTTLLVCFVDDKAYVLCLGIDT